MEGVGKGKKEEKEEEQNGRKIECLLAMSCCVKPEGNYQMLYIRIQSPSGKSCLKLISSKCQRSREENQRS